MVVLTRPQLHLDIKIIYHNQTTHAYDKQGTYNHKCILIAMQHLYSNHPIQAITTQAYIYDQYDQEDR
jgi:hypothetical protein